MRSSRVILVFLICFGFAAFLVLHYGVDLARDISISGDTLSPNQNGRVLSAKCTRWNFIVSDCSVEYDELQPARAPVTKFEAIHTLNFLMFGSAAGEQVTLMRSSTHPDVVTSAIGMNHLANRSVTLLLLVLIFAGTPLIMVVKLATGRMSIDGTPAAAPGDSRTIDAEIARQLAALGPQPAARSMRTSSTLAPPASAGPRPGGTFGRRNSFR